MCLCFTACGSDSEPESRRTDSDTTPKATNPLGDKLTPKATETVKEPDGFTGVIGGFEIDKGVLTKYRGDEEKVVLPDSVESIGSFAFYRSTLTSVEIPEGVTSIDGYAFQDCSQLSSVKIPESVTTIKNSAFSDCKSLTGIELPKSLTSIETCAFYGCTKLAAIEIPEGVTSIGADAFHGCSNLTEIKIPEGVTSIGADAFNSCKALADIEIPEGVTSIGPGAFDDTAWIRAKLSENPYVIVNGILVRTEESGEVVIPDGPVAISGAFSGDKHLRSVVIPESVTVIESRSFYECQQLVQVEIPNSVVRIGDDKDETRGAFEQCTWLTEIKIPDSVTSLGRMTFYGCTNLMTIEIPASVTFIGKNAFGECGKLTVVTEVGSYAAEYCENNGINYTTK